MARNEEKAQSMLYRFREAQAAELGLGTRSDRRPRVASACKSLRECERWRGEILREISRKVSKIQDAGLSDYEVRDVNDEINKLLREKRHWENQIVALGGANYRRNVAMLDDDGKEVPGTKGYKYFGRAKELPGVRELFQSRKKDEEEENQVHAYYKKFTNQGPVYFGDLDETDGKLLAYERDAEDEDWKECSTNVRDVLGPNTSVAQIPRQCMRASVPQDNRQPTTSVKRKVEPDEGKENVSSVEEIKKSKTTSNDGDAVTRQFATADLARTNAQAATFYIPFLNVEHLLPPKLPSHEEMENILLTLRKAALVEEYFGDSSLTG